MHSQISQTTSCFLNSLIIKGIKFSTPSLHACMASAISTLKTQIINHSYSRKQHIIFYAVINLNKDTFQFNYKIQTE